MTALATDTVLGHEPVVICHNPEDLTRTGSCPDCQPWCPTCRTEWPCPIAEGIEEEKK